MNSDYAAGYRTLYQQHWWWRAREAAILRLLCEYCPQPGRERILDIGCGDGLLFDSLARFGDVQGVEVCGELIAKDSPWRDRIYVGPFDEGYRPAGRFSLILMLDVLEHFADPLDALLHAGRLLEPQGLLVIHVPAFRSLWTSHDDLNHHFTRYTKQSLSDVLSEASLKLDTLQYTFHWTCPVKLAIRVKEWALPSPPRQPRVPSPAVNRLCYGLCRAEQWLYGRRSPRFGSSLLGVARHAASHEVPDATSAEDGSAPLAELCEV